MFSVVAGKVSAETEGQHERWMREAIRAARQAEAAGEVPVGACIVVDGEALAIAGNRTRTDCDPAGHAEIVALREAARKYLDRSRYVRVTLLPQP